MSPTPLLTAVPSYPVEPSPLPTELSLNLQITDPTAVAALTALAQHERTGFALTALSMGITAMQHMRGQLGAENIRREGERVMQVMDEKLRSHTREMQTNLANVLREYLDPREGKFSERIEKFVGGDGELANVLSKTVLGETSDLARAMAEHVGAESPIFRLLDPESTRGIVTAVRESMQRSIESQNEMVRKTFSFDSTDGALPVLVRQLEEKHGNLREGIRHEIQSMTAEFSLNNEQSALSRMLRCLGEKMEANNLNNARFQEAVGKSLASLTARQEAEARSTTHGLDFENDLLTWLERRGSALGDLVERTGNTPGKRTTSKCGDGVLILGSENLAAGARIAIEAKEDASYNVKRALEACGNMRKTREAQIALFVFSRKTCPADMIFLQRHDNAILVVWDPEDPTTDVALECGVQLARALCVRIARQSQKQAIDLSSINRAIHEIENRAERLETIHTLARTINNNAVKIIKQVESDQQAILEQVAVLRDTTDTLSRNAEA
ncbi:MAG: hypothetical protein SGI86_17445 [Deltaproteobacteria bacterium]|nr:hypothetical protein [Deltaproteobacteria bacterium]